MITSALAALRLAWTFRRYIAIAAGVIALIGALWWLRSAVWHAGYDKANAEWEARQRAAQAQAQADSWEIVGKFGEIDGSVTTIHQETAKAEIIYVPKIIRTAVEFYRDNPVCRPPDRLWRANDDYAAELARSAGIGTSPLRGDKDAGQ